MTKFLLVCCVLVLFLASCATADTGSVYSSESTSSENMTLIAKNGNTEVWKITDTNGVVINTCYLAINTYSNSLSMFCK